MGANHQALLMHPGWTPKAISDLELWLDAADSSTIHLSGSKVTQWDDKSGNAFNAGSSSPNRPIYATAAQNGLNAVDFGSGSGDAGTFSAGGATGEFFFGNTATLLRNVAGWTILLAFKTDDNAPAAGSQIPLVIFGINATIVGRAGLVILQTSGYARAFGRRLNADAAGLASSTTQVSTSWNVLAVTGNYSTTTCTLYLNGTQIAQNTSWLTTGNSSNDDGVYSVGGRYGGPGLDATFVGQIGEGLVYTRDIGSDLGIATSYLRSRWATA